MKKTLVAFDPDMRAKEEFAEYWPKALEFSADKFFRATHGQIRMQDMVDVFRTVYCMAFVHGSLVNLQEIMALDKMKARGENVQEFIRSGKGFPEE